MGTTSAGLPWMDPDDPLANVDLEMKALAEALVAPYVAPFTLAANWTTLTRSGSEWKLLGDWGMYVDFTVTRATSALTCGADGGIADTTIGTFTTAADRPVTQSQKFFAFRGAVTGPWGVELGTDGVLQLITGPPTATLAIGGALRIAGLIIKK